MDRIVGSLDPTTPEEYLEACTRFCELSFRFWDDMLDGDGVSMTSEDKAQTKTDMLRIIRGCADYGLDCLRLKKMVNEVEVTDGPL